MIPPGKNIDGLKGGKRFRGLNCTPVGGWIQVGWRSGVQNLTNQGGTMGQVEKGGWLILMFLLSCYTFAQTVNIWPGVAPGSENWKQTERTVQAPYGTVIINVVTPTLTAYLPEKSKATGTGIIVAPGGSCVAVVIEHEGTKVAQWLQERGIAAFLLKYRIPEKKGEGIPSDINFDEACKYGIADGIQAMKVVRQHATEWRVSPNRVGFMGFSAGAMVTSGVLLQSQAALRPAFVAPIYGAPLGVMPPIPANLPPIFMAWAQDDDLVLGPVVKFYDALRRAGNHPEGHIYSAGGHGFGMKAQGTSSDHWIEEFYWWVQAQGFAKVK
jgi:acetyl esterase/lipase